MATKTYLETLKQMEFWSDSAKTVKIGDLHKGAIIRVLPSTPFATSKLLEVEYTDPMGNDYVGWLDNAFGAFAPATAPAAPAATRTPATRTPATRTPAAPLMIAAPAVIPDATVGSPWSSQMVLTNSDASTTCDLGTTYPTGMSVSNTGLVSYTPSAADAGRTVNATVYAHKGTTTVSTPLSVHVNAAAPARTRRVADWTPLVWIAAIVGGILALLVGGWLLWNILSNIHFGPINIGGGSTPVACATAPVHPDGWSCKDIDGGYLFTSDTPRDFVVPSGWYAHYGIPVKDESGTIKGITQLSLYKGNAPAAPETKKDDNTNTCPDVTSFNKSTIDGGCLYHSDTPATFAIPNGWDAWYGETPHWQLDGNIPTVTTVSLYKDDPKHTAVTLNNDPKNGTTKDPATTITSTKDTPAANCPTLDEARKTFGLDFTLVGTETCAYTWTSPDGSYKNVVLKGNWMETTAEKDGIYITEGNNMTVSAHAVTIRYLPANPGLTSDLQYTLEYNYANLPQNNFANLVKCRTCTTVAAPATTTTASVPTVNGFTCSPIEGGYVCKSASPADFAIPAGYKALYGVNNTTKDSGTITGVTQVSIYPK